MAASKTLTPEERSLRAKIAAHAMHAAGKTTNVAAREAFLERFERQVPAEITDPAERRQRARHLRQQHMLSLAYKSALARKRRRASGA